MVANYLGTGFSDPNRSDLYLNQGGLPGTTPDWYTPDEIYSFSCAFGDVDNDGDLDVAFATGEGYHAHYQPNRIYRNDDGAFSNTASWSSSANAASLDVVWGDVDRDGDLDLAFTGDAQATCVYYNNAGVIEANPSWQASTVESGNTLSVRRHQRRRLARSGRGVQLPAQRSGAIPGLFQQRRRYAQSGLRLAVGYRRLRLGPRAVRL